MRVVAAWVATLLCAGASACGNGRAGSSPRVSANETTADAAPARSAPGPTIEGYLASDGDSDRDDRGRKSYYLMRSRGEDTFVAASAGDLAAPPDRRAVAALIERYYAAAAGANAVEACSLLDPELAAGLAEGQGQSNRGVARCAAALTPLLREEHRALVQDNVAKMVVIEVRVKADIATATIGFRAMPVIQIRAKRDNRIWRMDALLGTGMS